MADVFTALTMKRRRLLQEKQRILDESKFRVEEIDSDIGSIDRALSIFNNAVKDYLCPRCKGTGSVRMPDAAGQMEDVTCTACHGTGVKDDI